MSILFKIGSTDYTSYIVNGSYKVNAEEINETYDDCNAVTHYIHIRSKIKGTFDMAFKTQAEYSAFLTAFLAAKSNQTNAWTVIVTPNNTLTQSTISARVTFAPSRELTAALTDIIRRITVNIEER